MCDSVVRWNSFTCQSVTSFLATFIMHAHPHKHGAEGVYIERIRVNSFMQVCVYPMLKSDYMDDPFYFCLCVCACER